MIGFAVIYGILGTIDLILMLRYSRKELAPAKETPDQPVPAMQY